MKVTGKKKVIHCGVFPGFRSRSPYPGGSCSRDKTDGFNFVDGADGSPKGEGKLGK